MSTRKTRKGGQPPEDRSADYEVGYGKPPKHSRFKPGQSGNPRGRPRGTMNFDTAVREALLGPVTVVQEGKKRQIPRAAAVAHKLMERAIGGETRSMLAVLDMAYRIEPEAVRTQEIITDADEQILKLMADRAARKARKGAEPPDE